MCTAYCFFGWWRRDAQIIFHRKWTDDITKKIVPHIFFNYQLVYQPTQLFRSSWYWNHGKECYDKASSRKLFSLFFYVTAVPNTPWHRTRSICFALSMPRWLITITTKHHLGKNTSWMLSYVFTLLAKIPYHQIGRISRPHVVANFGRSTNHLFSATKQNNSLRMQKATVYTD